MKKIFLILILFFGAINILNAEENILIIDEEFEPCSIASQISSKISDIAFDFENSIIDVLITKTLKAAKDFNISNIVISGGVSANKKLRHRFVVEGKSMNIFFPNIEYSTDNGAMIAYLGFIKSKNDFDNSLVIDPKTSSSFF